MHAVLKSSIVWEGTLAHERHVLSSLTGPAWEIKSNGGRPAFETSPSMLIDDLCVDIRFLLVSPICLGFAKLKDVPLPVLFMTMLPTLVSFSRLLKLTWDMYAVLSAAFYLLAVLKSCMFSRSYSS